MRYSIILAMLFFYSCEKSSTAEFGKGEKKTSSNAIIHWSGMVAADGCDWVIQIDTVWYHPDKLDDLFKQEQLPVTLEYRLTEEKFSCGMLVGGGLPVINIISIRK